jgi:hypothetical protein
MAMNVSTSRTPAILTCRHAVVCAFALMALASLPDAGAPAAAAQKAAPQKPASQNAAAPKSVAARTFATPEEAAKALVDTVRKGDVGALLAIFGPDGQALLESSDRATARMHQQVFTIAAAERWYLEDAAPDRKTLVIGNEEWPFPVPLVKDAAAWRFDTAAGKEEILARRIGRNELDTIATLRAYVTAQHRYAAQGHDGKPPGLYATKLASDPGKQNGLYWPTSRGETRSPLGELVAQAAEEGRPINSTGAQQSPFHGYHFKILTAQGAAAAGGARSFIVKGDMSGGFAMVAWPAQYDATGVMTFLIGTDGTVWQKDLGPDTDAAARRITLYNPDTSWQRVR